MNLRMILAGLALLSQTGCVAAIPMAMQVVSGATTSAQLCSMTKMPGQTTTLCDRFASSFVTQPPVAAPVPPNTRKPTNGAVVTTAER